MIEWSADSRAAVRLASWKTWTGRLSVQPNGSHAMRERAVLARMDLHCADVPERAANFVICASRVNVFEIDTYIKREHVC